MRKARKIELSMMTFLAALLTVSILGAETPSKELPEGEILYYEEIQRGKGNLVVLDLESGTRRQVGKSGSRPDHFPVWSADGKQIAFESYRKGGWHVWVSDADGGKARRLSDLPDYSTSHYEFDPGFGPDNRTVAFVRSDGLWKVTLDRPTPVRITPVNNGVEETAPAFSPDGKWLAVAGFVRSSKSWDIYILKSDGSSLKNLTKGQGANFAPSWAPDGQHILFYSDRDGSFELYEMSSLEETVRPIFTQARLKTAGFKKAALVDPWDNDWGATEQYRASYSPDGRWIVFSRDISGDRELFVARRDGSEVHRITHRPGLDGQPAWRP